MPDYSLIPDFNSVLGNQGQARSAFSANQAGQESDYLNRYKTAIGGQETMSAMAKRIGDELNLPTLKENAYRINQTIRELPQTYSSATRGFDVNANQLSRIIGQKTSELAPAQATANEALGNAQTSLNTLLGYGQADQAKQLLPFEKEQSFLSDRLARESTGFNMQLQNELDSIIAKMNAGITLSEGEKNRAQQLAIAEMNYKAEMDKFNSTAKMEQSKGTIETIGGNKYLVNPYTGAKTLLGSASDGTGSGTGNISTYLSGNYLGGNQSAGSKDSGFVSDVNLQVSPSTINAITKIPSTVSTPSNRLQLNGNIPLNTNTNNSNLLYLLGR